MWITKRLSKILLLGGIALLTCSGMMACDGGGETPPKPNDKWEILSEGKVDVSDGGYRYIQHIKDREGREFLLVHSNNKMVGITQITKEVGDKKDGK